MSSTHIHIFRGAPMLSIVIPFIMGISMQNYWDWTFERIVLCFFCSSLLLLVLINTRILPVNTSTMLENSALFGLIAAVGMVVMYKHQIQHTKNHIENTYVKKMIWTGNILSKESTKGYAKAIIEFVSVGEQQISVQGKGIMYIYDNELKKSIHEGDQIQSSNELISIRKKGNPGEFDMRTFYLRQGISRQIFVRDVSMVKLVYHQHSHSFIHRLVKKLQTTIRHTLDKYIQGSKQQTIAKALLTGKKSNAIDVETRKAYIQAGVIHILVISGLHIGILSWLVSIILKPFTNKHQTVNRYIITSIHLLCIWTFCLIAGLGVSVLRAGIMFSFLQIGLLFKPYRQSSFQSLSVSAFVILILNPYALWQLGFQYSFLALLGIFIMHPYIQRIRKVVKVKVLAFFLEISLVSLAANLFILPLSIYTFGKLYPYFIITNVLAVPIASFTLYTEVATIIVSFFPSLAATLGTLCTLLVDILNYIVLQINSWYGSVLSVYCNGIEYMLYSTVVWCIAVYIRMKNRPHLYAATMLLFVGLALSSCRIYQRNTQVKLCAFNTSQKNPVVALIAGRKATIFVHNSTYTATKQFQYLRVGMEKYSQLSDVEIQVTPVPFLLQVFQHKEKKIAYILHPDALNLYQEIINSCNVIILPSSRFYENLPPDIQKVTRYSNTLGKPISKVHSLVSEGAFMW